MANRKIQLIAGIIVLFIGVIGFIGSFNNFTMAAGNWNSEAIEEGKQNFLLEYENYSLSEETRLILERIYYHDSNQVYVQSSYFKVQNAFTSMKISVVLILISILFLLQIPPKKEEKSL